jgi:hypothetical protein
VDAATRMTTDADPRQRPNTTIQLVAGARLSKTGPDRGFHCSDAFTWPDVTLDDSRALSSCRPLRIRDCELP